MMQTLINIEEKYCMLIKAWLEFWRNALKIFLQKLHFIFLNHNDSTLNKKLSLLLWDLDFKFYLNRIIENGGMVE